MTSASLAFRLALLPALALATTATQAAVFLTENFSASLDGATTVGGVALGDTTAFSFQAVFNGDPSANFDSSTPGAGLFPITALSISIAGHGSYAATLDTPLYVVLIDPSAFTAYPIYFAGLADDNGQALFPAFIGATPAFGGQTPAPTVFSDYLGFLANTAFSINLTGVPGGLVLPESGVIGPATASVTVPEPVTCTCLSGLALLAFAGSRQRRG